MRGHNGFCSGDRPSSDLFPPGAGDRINDGKPSGISGCYEMRISRTIETRDRSRPAFEGCFQGSRTHRTKSRIREDCFNPPGRLAMAKEPKVGQKAPDCTLMDDPGNQVKPGDLK